MAISPDLMVAIEAHRKMTDELRRRFEKERGDQAPFDTLMECPVCGGVVRGWYREPLYGGLTCSTPECVRVHF